MKNFENAIRLFNLEQKNRFKGTINEIEKDGIRIRFMFDHKHEVYIVVFRQYNGTYSIFKNELNI